MPEYKLPDVGEGLTEAEVVAWRVKVGDVIEVNEIVCDIETAKSIVELPSPYAGEVTALLVPEGETVAVGTPIIRIGADEGAAAGASPATPTPEAEMDIDLSNPAASGGGEGESLVGRNKADRGPTRRARRAPGAEAANKQAQAAFDPGTSPAPELEELPEVSPPPAQTTPAAPSDVRVLAKPPVRKLAKDLGVDLSSLAGDGSYTRRPSLSGALSSTLRRAFPLASGPSSRARSCSSSSKSRSPARSSPSGPAVSFHERSCSSRLSPGSMGVASASPLPEASSPRRPRSARMPLPHMTSDMPKVRSELVLSSSARRAAAESSAEARSCSKITSRSTISDSPLSAPGSPRASTLRLC